MQVTILSLAFGRILCYNALMANNTDTSFRFKRGIYETEYGNSVYVSGPNAKTGYDLDSGERVPIALVSHKFKRPVGKGETFGTGRY